MKHTLWSLWLVTLTGLIVACNAGGPAIGPAAGPHSWIDAPLDGSVVPLSPAIEITSHSADPLQIVQVELSVNGQVVQSSPNPNSSQTLALTKQQWSPSGPGNYTLRVRAQNSTSAWGEYAQAVVTIGSAASRTPAPPSRVPSPLPSVVPSSTPATKPAAPTTTATRLPPASITFFADTNSLAPGQCTTIRWQVTNVTQVTLDSGTVNLSGTKQDCPTQTTTHTLRALTLDGQTVQRTLTINVVAPSRTFTPVMPTATFTAQPPAGCTGAPTIGSFAASPSTISLGGSSTLAWGAVTNADSVEIDNGIGGVPAPGSRVVSPSVTTIYVLTARCKGNTTTARAMVTVLQPPTRTPTLSLRQRPTATPTRTPIVIR